MRELTEHELLRQWAGAAALEGGASDDEPLATLRDALKAHEDELHAINVELESANSKLRSSNDAAQSANEDLQATNEELETFKDDDMNNLLSGTGIATVFLDPGLNVLSFTPTASELINLMAGDIGRPVAQIASKLVDYTSLVTDTQNVLETLVPMAVDVQTERGRWFTMRA